LFQKHTLIILNEESHEEQFSFRLNRMNVLVMIALMTFFIIGCTTLTVLYTPLRDYLVPSEKHLEVNDKEDIIQLVNQIEDLEAQVSANDLYINNLRSILSGEVPMPEITVQGEEITTSIDLRKVDLKPKKEDLELRKTVEQEEMFSVK